jgi:hypothetical protein
MKALKESAPICLVDAMRLQFVLKHWFCYPTCFSFSKFNNLIRKAVHFTRRSMRFDSIYIRLTD